MSKASVARTANEEMICLMQKWQAAHPGEPLRMEHVATWAISTNEFSLPARKVHQELKRRLKKAARETRIEDAKGRKVRMLCAAKYERQKENGQKFFDVVWDHIHTMSLHHAEMAFDQRFKNLQRSATAHNRDVSSFNEFNPNAAESQLEFNYDLSFAIEAQAEQTVEQIDETGGPNLPR